MLFFNHLAIGTVRAAPISLEECVSSYRMVAPLCVVSYTLLAQPELLRRMRLQRRRSGPSSEAIRDSREWLNQRTWVLVSPTSSRHFSRVPYNKR
jgi:hypothetical protein